jgi:hypothetical protein
MNRALACAALAAVLAGCPARSPAARQPAAPPAPEAPPPPRAPRIVAVDLARVMRAHPRWHEVEVLDRQIGDLQGRMTISPDLRVTPTRIDVPKVDLTPEMKAAVERMRPEFQHEVEAAQKAARAELDAYAAQLRADDQRQIEAKRSELQASLVKAVQDKQQELTKDNQQFQQQTLEDYRLPLLNLRLKLDNLQESSKGQNDQLNAQIQALTKERDDKIAAHEKANQQALQDFQKEQIQKSNDELKALQDQLGQEGQKLLSDRAAELTSRMRTQLQGKQSEFNERLRTQEEALVASARETQARQVAQAKALAQRQIQAQIQSETERIRTLQGQLRTQLQTAQRQRAAVFSVILADVRIESAGLAQERGWDVVLTEAISNPGVTDVTDQLIARIKR